MGAPLHNRNALRHGLRGGQLPKGEKNVEVRLCKFRQTLEDAVLAAHHEVNLIAAATIQTIVRWERHAALAQRWLAKEGHTMTAIERLKYSREIAMASKERDKALHSLDLDH